MFEGEGALLLATTRDTLVAVAAWYSQAIGLERRQRVVDRAKVDELMERRRPVILAMNGLREMGPKELTEVKLKYSEELKTLMLQDK